MTSVEALEKIQTEIPQILTAAGAVDGTEGTKTQWSKPETVFFWDTFTKPAKAADRQTYIVWTVISADNIQSADNDVFSRDGFVIVDVFTRKTLTAKQTKELLTKLNQEAKMKEWSFELASPVQYETDTTLYHASFRLGKKIV